MALIAFLGDIHLRNYNLSSRLTDYNTALFTKLEFVYQTCENKQVKDLIILGDLNTTLDTDIKDSVKNQYIALANKYKTVKKYSIAGNHDLPSNNIDNLYKTSLYTLSLAHAYDLILSTKQLENLHVQALDVDIEKSRAILAALKDPNMPTLLLGHHLFNWDLNPDAGLTDADFAIFQDWKYPVICFLGDDHRQYKPYREIKNVTIHRLGSLMRTEKPKEDNNWHPHFAILNTETLQVEYIQIPCESFKEAFGTLNTNAKFAKLADLSHLKSSIQQLGTIDYSSLTVSKILKDMNTPADEMEYLRLVHETVGEPF